MKFLDESSCGLYKSAVKKLDWKNILKDKIIDKKFKSCEICGNLENCIKSLTSLILESNEETTSIISDTDLDEMLSEIITLKKKDEKEINLNKILLISF